MTKEEAKQWIRSQIDSSIIKEHNNESIFGNNNEYDLCYNKQYLRALKLSKINGKPVNKENFKGGDIIFSFNIAIKIFWFCGMIEDYLNENYSKYYEAHKKIVEEVLNEYDEYKGYNVL